MGSRVPDADMQAIVSLMQSSCEQSSRFVYKNILAPEAQQLLHSIHKTALPSTPATVTASTVVRCPTPLTTVPLTAARLLLARQPGCIVSSGQQLKIVVSSVDMLRSLNTRIQTEGQDEEEELADRSRSPSPPHPIFNGPVVRYIFYFYRHVICHLLFLFPLYALLCQVIVTHGNLLLHGRCNSEDSVLYTCFLESLTTFCP